MRPEDVWSDSMHGQRKQPKRSEVGHRLTDDSGQLHPDPSKMDSNWILALKAIFSGLLCRFLSVNPVNCRLM